MVVSEMKPSLKVSVSDSNSSSDEDSANSENEINSTVDSDDNMEADIESIDSEEDKKELITNEGWADSVAKILSSSKPKNKKTLVLSRAKKHVNIVKEEKKEKPSFEVIGDVKEEKLEIDIALASEPPAKKVKHDKPSIRIKPNILEKDRERLLSKIATKGVVQLFNAVRNQQKTIEKEINKKDVLESKKEKILKKFDKRAFLDTLMGQSKSIVVDEHVKSIKEPVKEEEKPKWHALRDDFMMGAKLKDWDKETLDE